MTSPVLRSASEDEIARDWDEFTGGAPIIGIFGEYYPPDVESLLWNDADHGHRGLATWWAEGDRAEIVSLHAEPTGSGAGTRIMDAAEEALRGRGVRRVVLATTNDNVRALSFYLNRGYRLVRVHLNAMERVRASKPSVPEIGRDGLPLRDMWEVEKHLE
jgi:GNAT superfamily N-acetyltransferase